MHTFDILLSLFLFALDKISILVGELAAKNLDKVNKVPDAEQTCRQRIKNTRADLADIVAVDAKPARKRQSRNVVIQSFVATGTSGAT